MKKNTIKAFTLVEMLIVIVIIGILIAALMPRMQAAQGRARDVSRKTALSQIQSAIVVYQGDHGRWPMEKGGEIECTSDNIGEGLVCEGKEEGDKVEGKAATDGIGIGSIASQLKEAGMSSIPYDPLKATVTGLGDFEGTEAGDYAYLVAERNGTENGGFALMAKTEVVGGSNWVVCPDSDSDNGKITSETDLSNDIMMCNEITKGDCKNDLKGNCQYANDSELRYLIVY